MDKSGENYFEIIQRNAELTQQNSRTCKKKLGHLFHFLGQKLKLLTEKSILWQEQKALLIADLHLGKAAHFRRAGIAIPQAAARANLLRLSKILQTEDVQRVLILGDLFHSDFNPEWQDFENFIDSYPDISFELIPGNHDRHGAKSSLPKKKLHIHPDELHMPPFLFSHHPLEDNGSLYNLAAHVHPAVRLQGDGRSATRLPCYYFGKSGGLLPAFGNFTGMHTIRPKQGDQVFVITEDEVIEV